MATKNEDLKQALNLLDVDRRRVLEIIDQSTDDELQKIHDEFFEDLVESELASLYAAARLRIRQVWFICAAGVIVLIAFLLAAPALTGTRVPSNNYNILVVCTGAAMVGMLLIGAGSMFIIRARTYTDADHARSVAAYQAERIPSERVRSGADRHS